MKKLFVSVAIMSLVGMPAAFAAGHTQASPKPSATTTHVAKTAGSAQGQATKPAAKTKAAAGKTHVVNAEFVSYDATSKMVTLKDAKGQTSTAPVEGKAVSEVAKLKANDKVKVTCRDNAAGEHQAVTAITAVKGKA